MPRRLYFALIVVFIVCLAWVLCSDAVISSLFGRKISPVLIEVLRGANNFILFGVTAIVLYWQIRKQQHRFNSSEKQYRRLFESNPNPMWVYHKLTWSFIAVNDAAIKKYGYTRQEFMAMTIRDIRTSDETPLLEKAIENQEPGINEMGVWKHIKKSGEVFPVSIVSHNVNFNGQSCRMVMATDINAIMLNEQKLQEAYQKEKDLNEKLATNYELIRKSQEESQNMAKMINKINNLILIISENGTISWVNQAFIDFTGYHPEQIIGATPMEILSGAKTDPSVVKQIRHSIQKKLFFSDEISYYKSNGELYCTQFSISPIYDEGGRFKYFISVENIITERKEKEEKILTQHAILQEIAWSNSHELRRPVCSILGLIGVLKNTDNDEERKECLDLLEKSSNELDQILKKINEKIHRLKLDENPLSIRS